MSSTGKILSIIFSIILIIALGFAITWGVINFNKVKEGMSGSGLYTEEDLQQANQDGYNQALEDKEEYQNLINTYRDTITELTDNVSKLNAEITNLKNSNSDYQSQIEDLEKIKTQNESTISTLTNTVNQNEELISTLTSEKTNLQIQVDSLNEEVANNEIVISSLNTQISTLKGQVEDLTQSGVENSEKIAELNSEIDDLEGQVTILTSTNTSLNSQITSLNSQISNLESLNSQLEQTNTSNLSTIATLNTQIQSLNSQIADLTYASQNSSSIISSLQAQVSSLEESIEYYESYISSLESDSQVVITFKFDNSVYNIQIINKGGNASVTNPASTDYVIFNYWMVNNEQIDLSTYTFSTNTEVVANVTCKYDVKFMVDNEEYNSQLVTSGEYAVLPAEPTKVGYEFDGWSVDGVNLVENINTTEVTGNVTYKAVFTKLHTVTFMVEDEVKDTQTIRNGNYATNVTIESTTYKIFNGWTLNGSIVNISTQKIVADTVFVASFTYKYDVKFMVDNQEYNSQLITSGGKATLPIDPTKEGYTFKGWSLSENSSIIEVSSQSITTNTTFYAVFEINSYTVNFKNGTETISTQSVDYNNYATLPEDPEKEGYTFKGWSLSENGSIIEVNSQSIITNTIFYAVFEINSYIVNFKNGTETISTQSVDYNNYATLPEDPEKEGYTFKGWSLSENGSIIEVDSQLITNNTTFYAVYEINIYTVTFKNGTETISIQSVIYNNYVTLPENPVKEGYTFKGWSLSENGEIVNNIESTVVMQNIVYYAIFILSIDGIFKYNSSLLSSYTLIVENGVLLDCYYEVSSAGSSRVDIITESYKRADGSYYVPVGALNSNINSYTLTFNSQEDCWTLLVTEPLGTSSSFNLLRLESGVTPGVKNYKLTFDLTYQPMPLPSTKVTVFGSIPFEISNEELIINEEGIMVGKNFDVYVENYNFDGSTAQLTFVISTDTGNSILNDNLLIDLYLSYDGSTFVVGNYSIHSDKLNIDENDFEGGFSII